MRSLIFLLTAVIASALPAISAGQGDTTPPVSPVLTHLTVIPENGFTMLSWMKSPSPDVAAYVIYYYRNGEGFAIDTLRDPAATSYLNTQSAASSFSVSYVVAALDYAGNISPLSNALETIFLQGEIDPCMNLITLHWNSYVSVPDNVTGYRILSSENGSPYTEAGLADPSSTSFSTGIFNAHATYYFIVEAILESGLTSKSNRLLLVTDLKRAPGWINADFASVNEDNSISLSFTIDQESEIEDFVIERRKETETDFKNLASAGLQSWKVLYTDFDTDPGSRYYYRLGAINSCGVAVAYSNEASNINAGVNLEENQIRLKWNSYYNWLGGVSQYRVFVKTGDSFYEMASVEAADTFLIINYADLMMEIKGPELCFYVRAVEGSNPHGSSGESSSAIVCTGTVENIFSANAFTPNGDNINDLFKPVFSFTPTEYLFTVSDLKNRTVFETRDHEESWDGKDNGKPLSQGVYLWFLKLRTPSGHYIERNGTVTILKAP